MVRDMRQSVADFNKSLDNFLGKQLPEVFHGACLKLGFEILTGLVFSTPVDTGQARNGWQVGIDSPSDVDRGTDGDPVADGNTELLKFRPGDIVHFSNNVNHSKYLDEGSSAQAPNGMVDVTLSRIGGSL